MKQSLVTSVCFLGALSISMTIHADVLITALFTKKSAIKNLRIAKAYRQEGLSTPLSLDLGRKRLASNHVTVGHWISLNSLFK